MSIQRRCLNETCSVYKKGMFNIESDSCRNCSYNIEENIEKKPLKKYILAGTIAGIILIAGVVMAFAFNGFGARSESAPDGNSAKTNKASTASEKAVVGSKETDVILKISGSKTIGAKLMPLIVEKYFDKKGATDIKTQKGESSNETFITFNLPNKINTQSVKIVLEDSDSSFDGLLNGKCNIAMSSRKINDAELDKFKSSGLGDMSAFYAENIIAMEALTIIVNNSNSSITLDKNKLGSIFAGEITDWEQVGGNPGKISVYTLEDKNELYNTFKELVLGKKSLAKDVKRVEDTETMASMVSEDKNAIGFVNLPNAGKNRIVTISEGTGAPVFPSDMNIATEDYPLTNRLYLYCASSSKESYSRELVDFALSEEGQDLMKNADLVSNNIIIEASKGNSDVEWENKELKEKYSNIVKSAEGRVSLNFRFNKGTSALDNKAMKDIDRVVRFLNGSKYKDQKIILIGFADNTGDYNTNLSLSRERAEAVRKQLLSKDPNLEMRISTEWFGKEQPMATNDNDEGKNKNRRVEVWLSNK